ncbi:LacI family regulatory protein (plasmid) [Ketogulonicigenium vulgare Y25]|uniref:ABC-type sugar transport system, periplasmic component n=1 Tax=Ketogulonicigenium vulgare (strain WSH-001) TaxID=759362 RepID=F9YBD2_KETVW|nr:LacI family DNA-binding transcriptional regulator [Ketogulonicigenium vulgare]ADO44247.1 LacI family regulatory protein [Ketogulonicigenium vulgare Y25]AEM42684.1 ABC-type sugar transport system, periplasmic component [Ketogulonicigenium vulgare WSH-001]ALJ82864.1 sugar ABC transporter substrate-binding protein [Ketogulonicigenium vulgare]
MPRRTHDHTTFEAIAAAAGVSLSSVDRVLNERGSVSEKTRQKVLAAAREMGINRNLPEAWHRVQHVDIILPRNQAMHWQVLDQTFQALGVNVPRWLSLHRQRLPQNDFKALRDALLAPPHQRAGLIIAADAAEDIAPALREVMARGEKLVTLTTEVPGLPAHGFSGINNITSGRTAGYLMRRLGSLTDPGAKVLIMQGNARRLEHFQRVEGFRAGLGDIARQIFMHVDETEAGAAERALRRVLADGERISGLYCTGTYSEELGPLMAAMGGARPIWITHDKTPAHEALMQRGLLDFVLDQDSAAQAAWALALMITMLSGEPWTGAPQLAPELRLFCCENLSN